MRYFPNIEELKCDGLWKNRERNRYFIVAFLVFWIVGYLIIILGVTPNFPITAWKSYTLTPYEDTYVDSANPTSNYGNSPELWISSTRTTFIKFNLEAFEYLQLLRVEFRCKFEYPIDHIVRYTSSNWNEGTLSYQILQDNYNSIPRREPYLQDYPIIYTGLDDEIMIDDIRSIIANDLVFSFVISIPSYMLISGSMNSKENENPSISITVYYSGITNLEIYITVVYTTIMLGIFFFIEREYRMYNIYYDYYCTTTIKKFDQP